MTKSQINTSEELVKDYHTLLNMDNVTRSFKIILIALIRKNKGEILLNSSEIQSVDIDSEIEITTNPDKTITLKEFNHK